MKNHKNEKCGRHLGLVAGSDLGVEVFEAVTSPGTMEEGQPGNGLRIPTVSPSWNFEG